MPPCSWRSRRNNAHATMLPASRCNAPGTSGKHGRCAAQILHNLYPLPACPQLLQELYQGAVHCTSPGHSTIQRLCGLYALYVLYRRQPDGAAVKVGGAGAIRGRTPVQAPYPVPVLDGEPIAIEYDCLKNGIWEWEAGKGGGQIIWFIVHIIASRNLTHPRSDTLTSRAVGPH